MELAAVYNEQQMYPRTIAKLLSETGTSYPEEESLIEEYLRRTEVY